MKINNYNDIRSIILLITLLIIVLIIQNDEIFRQKNLAPKIILCFFLIVQ